MTTYRTVSIFFIVVHIIFILDFGFITGCSRKLAPLVKIISMIQVFCFVVYCYYVISYFNEDLSTTVTSVTLVQMVIHLTILIFFNRRTTFSNILKDIASFDSKLRTNMECSFNTKLILYSVLSLTSDMLIILFYGYITELKVYDFSFAFVLAMPFITFNITMCMCCLIFYYINCHLKEINRAFTDSTLTISECLFLFKHISDILDQFMNGFEILVSIIYLTHCK
ncbi:unnamed protein product [Diatraea saccharalis]|uniref:Gustatory receptor n=1 Tax=Diatraea saccharalis TaxID=40085 RepID=A0A9N9RC07_9NEOP|nr:unnamed protein product [Diatraea saccharalis]